MSARRRQRAAGFTLLEAMATLALTAIIALSLGALAGQWLPNWRRGFADLQNADLVALGLDRVLADLSAAEFVPPNAATPQPVFFGERAAAIFVRSAIGPDSRPHLEFVRLAEVADARGFSIVRSRAPFAPMRPEDDAAKIDFADPVALAHGRFRLAFAYAGPDRAWRERWGPSDTLPDAVRVTVRDAANGERIVASSATRLKAGVDGLKLIGDGNAPAADATPAAPAAAPPPGPTP